MKKKIYGILAFAFLCVSSQAQPFIHYGNNSISKEEFLRAYNKNKTPEENREKSIREYVDLYTNFKLKVKAAEELRLDTLPQIQFDVKNFRQQIIENYLNNEKGVERLTQEAISRYQKDLHVIHFSIPAGTGADSAKAVAAINELYTALKSNNNYNAAFQSIAVKNGALKQSDFGFVTAFTLPYQYENIVYSLQPGEVSKPYRSKTAWHIFKVTEERPNAGRWRVAQILVAVPENAPAAMVEAAKQKADDIYKRLQGGEGFGNIAKLESQDRMSNFNGGELPEFTTATYSAAFENEVFKLKNDGDVSKPFLTPFGFHIVKRLGFRPTPAGNSDEVFANDIRQKVLKDDRINEEKERFNNQIVAEVGAKKTKDAKEADLFRYADSLMKNPTEEQTRKFPISNKKILQFKNGAATGEDWLMFVRENKGGINASMSDKELWDKFTTTAAINYYKSRLEEYNPDFAFQMKEFREGNMLFEIMERNVWSKASNDNAGLSQFYNEHKNNYKWAASADVLIFNCSTPKVAEDALSALKKGKFWKLLAAESNSTIQADSGRYELSQISGVNLASPPAKDSYSAIVTNIDGTSTFVKYVNVYPANQPRSFDEARGLVINDYQQELEQQWVAQLRKKYPVRVNETILKEIIK
ncbi:MAG: peptidylprolyl isomerase [Ferruginibacter sp.]